MGIQDSSKTRVVPVFDELLSRHPMDTTWVSSLLDLPKTADGGKFAGKIDRRAVLRNWGWGNAEKRLRPCRVLLQWLVCCPREPPDGNIGSSDATRSKRQALLLHDEQVIGEALAFLARKNVPLRAWYVLEGPSQPDVYLETDELIVVIEGKRTESGPTTDTSWMEVRHQILRHLDCAWEVRGEKSVFGFFIVEGKGEADAIDVPQGWVEACRQTVSKSALRGSLPHRLPEERREIADAFLGATTWQAVCRKFGIDWATLPDEVEEDHV
jgi:hypothetical protein